LRNASSLRDFLWSDFGLRPLAALCVSLPNLVFHSSRCIGAISRTTPSRLASTWLWAVLLSILVYNLSAFEQETNIRFMAKVRFFGSGLLVLLWVVSAYSFKPEAARVLKSLRLEPEAIVLPGRGAAQHFTLTAIYSDGTETDAARTARVTSLNPEVVAVDTAK